MNAFDLAILLSKQLAIGLLLPNKEINSLVYSRNVRDAQLHLCLWQSGAFSNPIKKRRMIQENDQVKKMEINILQHY